jgi:outer membrane protein assembly factor BamD
VSRLAAFRALVVVISITFAAAGCSTTQSEDELLEELASLDKETIFERAEDLYADKKYEQARKLFSFVYDTFPNDPMGHKAALRVADTYSVKNDTASLTEARLRYRDFANRYPNDPDRDYALLMVGHTYSAKKLRPDRDLSTLRESLDAYQQLITLYPGSRYAPEAAARMGALRETLAEHEWQVAQFYARNKRWTGALWRLEYIRDNYLEYSKYDRVAAEIERVESKLTERRETMKRIMEERQKKLKQQQEEQQELEQEEQEETKQDPQDH